jgi:hypothetical protein
MKSIYRHIISEGTTGVSDNSGENAKGENLGLIAGDELFRMVELFPEMLEMLKRVADGKKSIPRKEVRKLIAKAEGVE